MSRFFNSIVLVSGVVIIVMLLLEAWRENVDMDWQKYQHKYKNELMRAAKTEQDRVAAGEYEIKLRQIVVPKLNRADRCVTCHAAIEDSRMRHMANPLKGHPGDYLDKHDINTVGCTSCHDGQGRAVTVEAAHGRGAEQFWETPLLKGPFIESTCVRCHANTLQQTVTYNSGKALIQQRGCLACHSIGDIGGVKGPTLSDIGRASFHTKMPIHENRERLVNKFDGNVNLAYLYEAVTEPDAQPKDTLMKKMDLSEDEVTAVLVYLKSLSVERRAMDVGVSQTTTATVAMPMTFPTKGVVTGASAKGHSIFSRACVACHTVGLGDRVGPDLKGVTSRRNEDWLKSFIQYPNKKIEERDPIVMELLQKYKTPMVNMGLSAEDVEEVIKYLKKPEAISLVAEAGKWIADGSKKARSESIADIAKGMALFQGMERFLHRGPTCITCHDIRNNVVFGGGRLAKELTTSFARLGDAGISGILQNPPFPLMRDAYQEKPLTGDEISALVAFLEKMNKEQVNQQPNNYGPKVVLFGFCGLILLCGFYCTVWFRGKRKSVNKRIYDRQIKASRQA